MTAREDEQRGGLIGVLKLAGSMQAAIAALATASPLLSAVIAFGVGRKFSEEYAALLSFAALSGGFAAIGETWMKLGPDPRKSRLERLDTNLDKPFGGLAWRVGVGLFCFVLFYALGSNGNLIAIAPLFASAYLVFSALMRLALLQAARSDQRRILTTLTPKEQRERQAERERPARERAREVAGWRRSGDVTKILDGRVPATRVEGSDVQYFTVADSSYAIAQGGLDSAGAKAILDALRHLRRRSDEYGPWLILIVNGENPTAQAVGLFKTKGVELFYPEVKKPRTTPGFLKRLWPRSEDPVSSPATISESEQQAESAE